MMMDENTNLAGPKAVTGDGALLQKEGAGGPQRPEEKKVWRILLLTNRDSDNTGDQVIEACDIALISAVMKNLKKGEDEYVISSRAASLISQKYIETNDPKLLEPAETAIQNADVVIFGGAPVFNYLYQTFYERTARTLEVAQKYHVPVLFSAIGVERYDEENKKCQRLKETLNFDCVRQITTRDGYEALQKYKSRSDLVIGKVSDPAVFTSTVFQKFISKPAVRKKKKVGIFVLRANGFKDNKINFTREDAASLWKRLGQVLEKRGYDYEFVTSGHFGDEAFLDYLTRNGYLDLKRCIFNVNTPEKLITKISGYDGVVSCRLHPSIVSFSLDVPSVGIVWNQKVPGFYESFGYGDRVIRTDGISAERVVDSIERAMESGVQKDRDYLRTVYDSLFYALKGILCGEGDDTEPYDYAGLMENIPIYAGTSGKEKDEKIKRKFRRTYQKYNDLFGRNVQLKLDSKAQRERLEELERTVEELKKENGQLKMQNEEYQAAAEKKKKWWNLR